MKSIFDSRGAVFVEFAFLLPILLVLTFGLIEFGLFMYNQQVLANAAREGARYGIVQVPVVDSPPRRRTELEIQNVVMNYLKPPKPDGTVGSWRLITFNTNPDPQIKAPDTCNIEWQREDYRRVTISLSTPYLVVDDLIQLSSLSLVRIPPITLSTESVMQCE